MGASLLLELESLNLGSKMRIGKVGILNKFKGNFLRELGNSLIKDI